MENTPSTKKKIKNHLYQVNRSPASSSPPPKNKNKKAGLPWWLSGKKKKNMPAKCRTPGFNPRSRKIPHRVHHNYWACALEPQSHNYRAHVPRLRNLAHPSARILQQEKPPQREAAYHNQREAPLAAAKEKPMQQRWPSTAINHCLKYPVGAIVLMVSALLKFAIWYWTTF